MYTAKKQQQDTDDDPWQDIPSAARIEEAQQVPVVDRTPSVSD
ncbi:hypothetical protein SNOG_08809 [Parastagonospora nodorum SN15]|uniref:Uncharacterized protein n=1 Tax=Phaeosphaeria nodorum (strain SN15 / ATCC MYA-4574 / FGSC 10173) TaxID=321614 RepID=Q0UHF5_PHANO|nr:hypothetical protein SNOG_08809 [Parastagonospora nodorum SN15]EAT83977.1 hypothetical protein SNOG_08809 [Parastagonospora nodorum SN15]